MFDFGGNIAIKHAFTVQRYAFFDEQSNTFSFF